MTTSANEIKSKRLGVKRLIYVLVSIFTILVIILFWPTSCNKHSPPPTEQGSGENVHKNDIAQDDTIRRTTPCEIYIDYAFKIKSTGPISIDFPGNPKPYNWNGIGDFHYKGYWEAGIIKFKSTNQKESKIKIWR